MGKYLNAPDLIMIALSSYVFVWGANYILRTMNMGSYQA